MLPASVRVNFFGGAVGFDGEAGAGVLVGYVRLLGQDNT